MARNSRNNPHGRNTSPEIAREDVGEFADTAAGARVDSEQTPAPLPPSHPPAPPTTTGPMFTVANLRDSFVAHGAILVRAGTTKERTLRWYQDQFKHLDGVAGLEADKLRLHNLGSVSYTNAFVRSLKRLYKWAAEERLVAWDPFAKLPIPPCGKRERVLTRAELARLYRATNREFRRLLFVQLRTIARPGEIRELTWGQINWEQRCAILVEFKGKKKRKDQLRARPIALRRVVLRMLRNLQRKSPDPSPAGRVFRNTDGEPWNYNAVRSAMRRARQRAGLMDGGEKVVCYSLRHTGATDAVRKGLDLKHIAELMGHARTSTTERYVHLNTADVVNAIDRLDAREHPPGRPAGGDPPAKAG